MNYILFDSVTARRKLLPFTYTRPMSEIRVGILTITEKWESWLGDSVSYLTEEYLSNKYPTAFKEENLYITGNLCPNKQLVAAINALQLNQKLVKEGVLLASMQGKTTSKQLGEGCKAIEFEEDITLITQNWHIFKNNGSQIRKDYKLITTGRKSETINDPYTRTYKLENIFIEEGASIKDATLNAENGPIYIGKEASIEEGAIIRGPFAICHNSTVNTNARMRGDITIGPWSKVGGEVSNSVIFGFSNKGHDGFLGNSVLGEWCNIGADTNTSNLKNNYDLIKVWDYDKGGFLNTGEQFCGLMMGDHSKCGINTMFNTGTIVGVAANIFGAGFPRTFIPSFAWGGPAGFTTFKLPKVFEMTSVIMKRRHGDFNEIEKEILSKVFELEAQYRTWENN
ncbi:MAG: GlmU family protein [Cyclobacteriaceae bacterium]|nr:GlmU family protein [Cyclobacteriaceae bacterium]